ncbi:hypothetical protein [Saccharopolyspora sp. ASAGF58]|uniref:hypothetical protein n=1 Tax=Saccharopolyspora sp. ASAGF58 TaxID=2719023 RepID=UPI00143FCF0E|nr:hypothetical protein [Saccharopolyspora sp. ASAGF58]QIZ38541.1 hypothetical protein FDZ84_33445 [Saccharopolyspora sp. ASAGF58]
MRNKLLARVTLPHQDTRNPAPLSQHHRLALIRRLVTDEDIPLLTRVAAILMLLYAQPLTRILRLTVDETVRSASGSANHPHRSQIPSLDCCNSTSSSGSTSPPLPTPRHAGCSLAGVAANP